MLRSPSSLALGMSTTGDPEDPSTASGWPASLLSALREVAAQVVGISDAPTPGRARVALAAGALRGLRPSDLAQPRTAKARLGNVARAGGPYSAARARSARLQLAGAGPLDGFVQNGADYPAPAGLRMVTYQDSTVLQALRAYEWPHLQGLSQRDIDGLVRRQAAAYASAVACCASSHWTAASIISDYGMAAGKVHVVGLGSNETFAEQGSAQRDWSRPRFLFVGFDWKRKNGQAVLDAFAKTRESFPDATLDLVGGHPRVALEGVRGHGPLALDDPASRAKLTALYREATVFLMPSLHEPTGTVHVEAAAAGIASIGTSNGGPKTCIGDGGYVVDPRAPAELLDAMLKLCNPETAQRLGALGPEHAKLFTWRKVAERIVRALEIPDLDLSGYAEYL
jgi:glycosyltransferase involved in cell wall biosynthesis